MSVRKLSRLAVPAATVVLTLAAGLAPGQAASAGSWSISATAGVAGDQTEFESLVATGAADAWAAGVDCAAPCPVNAAQTGTLVVDQWNGAGWQQAPPSSLPATMPPLARGPVAVGASSATNAWVFATTAADKPVAVRWDGAHWGQPALPNWFASPQNLGVVGVSVLSARNVWVFNLGPRYAAHYNGTSWAKVPLAMNPMAVSATSPAGMWAVGITGVKLAGARAGWAGTPGAAGIAARAANARRMSELVKHWTGRAWRTIRMPSPYLRRHRVFVPTSDWAAGLSSFTGPSVGVILKHGT